MDVSEHSGYNDFAHRPYIKPNDVSGMYKAPVVEVVNHHLKGLWMKLESIVGEFSQTTGMGVLVATNYPESAVHFGLKDESRDEFYLNFLPHGKNHEGAVKVRPIDCERCFQQTVSDNSRKDFCVQVGDSFRRQEKVIVQAKKPLMTRKELESITIDTIDDIKGEPGKDNNYDDDYPCKDDINDSEEDCKDDVVKFISELTDLTPELKTILGVVGESNGSLTDHEPQLDFPEKRDGDLTPEEDVDDDFSETEKPAKKKDYQLPSGELVCGECGKVFATSRGLKVHKGSHRREKRNVCNICGKKLFNLPSLRVHLRTHTGERPFKCKECPQDFTDAGGLRKHHRRIHSKVKPFKCPHCDKSFSVAEGLKNHSRTHKGGEKPFQCDKCEKGFFSKYALKKHNFSAHSDNSPFLCNICGKGYQSSSTLKDHLSTHNVEKPHVCNSCGRGFWTTYSLFRHQEESKSGPGDTRTCKDKPYECETCHKEFSHKGALNVHMVVHSGEKPFQCSDCGKSFAWESNLKIHYRKHTGEKPFECATCGSRFANPGNYKAHVKRHTLGHKMRKFREKTFRCDECDKMFTTLSNLERHKMIHKGIKPFKCQVCGKAFIQSNSLRTHFMTHTGEKPWKCNFCERAFSDSRALKNHSKMHTEHILP